MCVCVCACVFQFRSPHLCVKHTLPLVRRHLGLLRFQVISVYWFAALAKLEKDWLDGSALLGILGHRYEMAIVMTYGGESRAGDQSLARSLAHSLFVITIDLLSRLPFPPVAHRPGLFVDSSIPLFLILAMNPRLQRHRPRLCSVLRWSAIAISTGFNGSNFLLFPLGIFPLSMLACNVRKNKKKGGGQSITTTAAELLRPLSVKRRTNEQMNDTLALSLVQVLFLPPELPHQLYSTWVSNTRLGNAFHWTYLQAEWMAQRALRGRGKGAHQEHEQQEYDHEQDVDHEDGGGGGGEGDSEAVRGSTSEPEAGRRHRSSTQAMQTKQAEKKKNKKDKE